MFDCSASALSALNDADSRSCASVIAAIRSCPRARSCSRSERARIRSCSSSGTRAAVAVSPRRRGRSTATTTVAPASNPINNQRAFISAPPRMARPADGMPSSLREFVRMPRSRSTVTSSFAETSRECSSATPRVSGPRRTAYTAGCATARTGRSRPYSRARPRLSSSMLEFIQSGPPRARVEDVDVQDAQPEGLSSFEVR